MSEWVTAAVVAEHLSLDYQTVLLHARTNKIPGSKIGGIWRFSLDDIDAHLRRPADKWVQSPQSRGRKRVA
jgi:excisionase family DNA binding protein